ncbi:hypothetical protein BaRGS_00026907, partial [Batillaria attramentaria]
MSHGRQEKPHQPRPAPQRSQPPNFKSLLPDPLASPTPRGLLLCLPPPPLYPDPHLSPTYPKNDK